VQEVYRILKPGGRLFIFSPNRWFPFETHGVRIKSSNRRVPHWVPFIPYIPLRVGKLFFDYWARNYWHRELNAIVTSAGFSVVKKGFIWQTFENISGRRPRAVAAAEPLLRFISNTLEKTPLLKQWGVSQALVCRKPGRDE
jgi:SAM-dependent methyltransferase